MLPYRALLTAIILMSILLMPAGPLAREWGPDGVPVCSGSCSAYWAIEMVPDRIGGAFLAWADDRNRFETGYDIYLQRITTNGEVAPGWPAGGLPICTQRNSQYIYQMISDGEDGVFLVWIDFRDFDTNLDIYVQRIHPNGAIALGWPDQGAPATQAYEYQTLPSIALDGSGGVFVAWEDHRNWLTRNTDIYAQHLTAYGEVAEGWPKDGLAICTAPGYQEPRRRSLLPDGEGGAVMVWNDGRADRDTSDIYAQHFLSDGSIAPGWIPNGNLVIPKRSLGHAVPDGGEGFYVGCATHANDSGWHASYYLQSFRFAGHRASGWPEEGVLACWAPSIRHGLEVSPDGFGGVILGWFDYRPGSEGGKTFVTRFLPSGTLAPGWTPNGIRVGDNTIYAHESEVTLSADGEGGVYVGREFSGPEADICMVQHLASDGSIAAGWPPYGWQFSLSGEQFEPTVIADGAGGVIAAWHGGPGAEQIRAQRVLAEGPVPTLPTLMSAEATMEKVTLLWFASEGPSRTSAYRRSESSAWQVLGYPVPDAAGHIRYEDRSVSPGARYAYRLGFLEGASEQFTDETWVEIPSSQSFALGGLQPNPSAGKLVVQFSLPSARPATLEIIDVRGRVLFKQDVGALGPGSHTLDLTAEANPGPGIYWIRLRQGEQELVTRGAVLR